MSARQQLINEVSQLPEAVAGQLLVYLHSLPSPDPASEPAENFWESHWSKIYGSCEGMEWFEPEEQARELREEW